MSASEFAAVLRLAYLPRGILADEVDDLGHRGRAGELLGDLLQPLLERPLAREQQAVGLADTVDLVAAVTAPLHADDVDSREPGAVAHHRPERDHVALHAADAADHGAEPDPHELMDRRQPAQRSEEHTSELQSLMRNSYAVF